MARSAQLLSGSILFVQTLRLLNAVTMIAFVAVLIATLPGAEVVEAMIVRKYHGAVDAEAAVTFMRCLMLIGLPVGYAVERLLAALRAMLRTVQSGDPFVVANAARLRTIGWMLLAVQCGDLAMGAATLVARALHVDFAPWQPSFTGWIAVLVAFVLAQVFERGAAMRDDLDGTI